MKKLLSMFMVLALLAASFAGCGETSLSASESAAEPEPAAESVSEETAARTEVEAPEAESEKEAASNIEDQTGNLTQSSLIPDVETVAEPGTISYPLTAEDPVITIWSTVPDGPTATLFSSYNEQYALAYAEEDTGITLKYYESSTGDEAFNLMIVAGDWCDLIPVDSNYTGGLAKAYSDEVIIDLTDLIAANAPDMWSVYCGVDDETWANMLTSGMLLAFYSIEDEIYTQNGMMTRADLAAEQGYSFGAEWTLEEFTAYVSTMKDAYDMSYAIVPTASASLSNLYCFDMVTIPDVSGDATDMYVYVDDGTVESAWSCDGYRSYIEWFTDLYQKGIFPLDFYTDSIDQMAKDAYILADETIIWGANADNCTELEARAEEGSAFEVVAVPNVVKTTEAECDWLEASSRVSTDASALSISSNCDNPELVVQYMNYWFTEAGSMLYCYGEEGISYTVDENGDPQWTELIYNNPDGFNVGQACKLNNMYNIVNGFVDSDRLFNIYAETGSKAIEIWTMESASSDHYYPDAASLNTEETDKITSAVADLCTYTSTQVLKWMIGQETLDDAAWEAYLSELDAMGIDDIVAVYQNAYDEYLAGTR